MNRYMKLLNKAGIDTYIITTRKVKSAELFFIKKNLDMRRMKDVEHVGIEIFKDSEENGQKLRARAALILNPSMKDEEILERIEAAEYEASFAMNPFFELPEKETSDEVVMESTLNGMPLSKVADAFVEAVYSEDCDEKAFINSFELFVNEGHTHIITSEGTDVAYVKREVKGEFVAQCKDPQDVETYQNFTYDSMTLGDIKNLVKTTLKMTADRAIAKDMPKSGNTNVIISDKYMADMVSFYFERAHSAYVFMKYSNYAVGTKVQGEDVKGDLVNIDFGVSVPFNEEGIAMKEREFIREGELKTMHGSMRFSRYLGMKPIGTYSKAVLPEGSVSFAEMVKEPCLHVVNFSDFQMDSMSGHFGGEIRLAYYYDGKGNVKPVTGGSVNGIIFDAQKDMYFSKEMQNIADYSGPRALLLKNIAVAGE